MRIVDAISYNNQTSQILTEGYQDLTESQKIYLNRWERELWPLMEEYVKVAEQQLTADQIQAIFQGAEKQAMASGTNKTMLGKVGGAALATAKLPIDIAKAVDKKINELGRLAQNAGPIKNMDAKFEELKKKIGDKDSKIVAGVKRVSDWAKDNPGKASLAVGILTTVAAFAGGPAGGAAAGLVLRASKDLLQGEKLSTAVGKSAKTAAYGALAGMAFNYLTDDMIGHMASASEAEADAMMNGFEQANFDEAVSKAAADAGFDKGVLDGAMMHKSSGNINGFYYSYYTAMTPDQVSQYQDLLAATQSVKTFSPEYYQAAGRLHEFLSATQVANEDLTELALTIQDIPKDMLTSDQIDQVIAVLDDADEAIKVVNDSGGALAAAAQGALQTVDSNKENMHKVKPLPKQLELELKGGGDKKESVEDIDVMEHLFEQYLLEKEKQGELPLNNPNSLGAKFKRGVGKAAGAVGKGAKAVGGTVKSVGKELGQKVTAKKLNRAWVKLGKPTDSGSIYNLLSSQGLSDDSISAIGKSAEVNLASTTSSTGDTATSGSTATSKDGPNITNRMSGAQKAGFTWKGGQWVNDKTGKIGSTAKLGNPLITQLAQEIKATGQDGIEQFKQVLGAQEPAPKKAKVLPAKKQSGIKRAINKVIPAKATVHSKAKSPTA